MTYNARKLGVPNLKMRLEIDKIQDYLRMNGQYTLYGIIRKRENEIKEDYYHEENHFIDGVMFDIDNNLYVQHEDEKCVKWLRRQLNLYKLLIITE